MRVREVMSMPVQTVQENAEATVARELMQMHRIGHLVVVDSRQRPHGVIAAADLGGPGAADRHDHVRVADLITGRIVSAAPTTTIREAANLMRGNGVHCLPVFERGRLIGIVTALDLLELVGRGTERPVSPTGHPVVKHWRSEPHASVRAKRVHRSRLERT
jgi:CBS-domain-containing membrane protein